MFENPSINKNEHPTEAEIRADFESREKEGIKGGTNFLENLEPEKFKNSVANLLLAFSLFAGASSAFAGEQKIDKDLPAMGEEQQVIQIRGKVNEKNNIAVFDWEKVSKKIGISIGATNEDVKEFHAEAIAPFWNADIVGFAVTEARSEFYKGVTGTDAYQSKYFNYQLMENSQDSSDFFTNLSVLSQKGPVGLNDKQKALALQQLGALLNETYNYDMFDSGERVEVSNDKMFEALKNQYYYQGTDNPFKSGICGNTHTFLTRTAEGLGLEAWLQSGSLPRGAHVWSGMVLGSGAEKQIAFLDYGMLIPTGTLNYKDALGIAERYHQSASIFTSFVGNETEVLFPVKSRAQETIEKASGVEGAGNKLEKNLETGKVEKGDTGVEININQEVKKIKLTSNNFGLIFFDFKDSFNNPYQSMADMNAWRVHANAKGENLGVEADATILHMNIKDLYGGSVSKEAIITRLAGEYIDKKQLTKGEYGKFLLNFGATFEGAVKFPTEGRALEGVAGEGGLGARLIYLDPSNLGKFYVGASEVLRGQASDSQNQKTIVKETAKNFVVGGEIKVFEGNITNIEVGKKDLDWGKSLSIKGGVEGETFKGNVGYEKKMSDYERFVPSSEKIEVGVSYKGGPMWEVDVIGAKTTEKYKDAQSQDIVTGEVKLKMFLW